MRDRSPTGRTGIRSRIALVAAIAVAGLLTATPALAAGSTGASTASTAGSVRPNATGELDCNGYSKIQKPVRKMLCTDLHGLNTSNNGRFYDNGWYIGHDEPDLRFLSSVAGSGNNVTWTERLGVDPAAAPTVTMPGHDITHYLELTPAPWFSMAMCDPQSYPENACKPMSDANAPAPSCLGVNPSCQQKNAGAGSAFMELQFYPPGFAPFADSISCDNTHWCAALTIDSLECTLSGSCNPNCVEPVNFSFIQTNGVPTGPPSPQLADLATFTPNQHTLLLNPGDAIRVHMFDGKLRGGGGRAFTAIVTDLTTHQSGSMQASAANGFMDSNPTTCNGTPFNFQPEYSTASADSIVPWAALQVDISTEFEIGHFEPCAKVTQPATLTLAAGVTDTYWQHCTGAYETTTSADSKNFEGSDAPCYRRGDTHGGLAPPNVVTGCITGGDVDFDGTPYWADWPTGTSPSRFPSTFLQRPPTTGGQVGYSQFQFQTDVALSEPTCAGPAGPGCSVPPPTAPGAFYPYWTNLSACTWGFGNVPGSTYGRDAQYGTDRFATIGYPEFESPLMRNTCG